MGIEVSTNCIKVQTDLIIYPGTMQETAIVNVILIVYSTIKPGSFPPEVIPYDQWTQQKPETKPMFSGWLKGAFGGGKKEMQESIQQNLNFILSTAPIWDRVELKGNKYVLGEFLEFKGKPEDLHALRNIKRSKVSRLIIDKHAWISFSKSSCAFFFRNHSAFDAPSFVLA
ncbi:uncharacterized protein LOC133779244 [Humulus lupulus]|uniref:uncharacterized protein LOC133779244 n=1 Tax=Humulus lupulus TaxID=3486 RepID=UPI002B416EFE|nr:uncharacterized protein LOC133779244 [Humulus lupulus]